MGFRFWWILGACLSSIPAAHAVVFTVGTGNCRYADIGSAAAAANAQPGPDEIHVMGTSGTSDYTQQAISISVSAGEQLDIIGGFADCTQAASTGTHTILDGAGGAAEPVLRITAASGARVRLSYLTLQHGDEDGSGKGGGIYFSGAGTLELDHCSVIQNTAGYGGGIYMQGTSINAKLVIGESVAITSNTARFDGGGVVADGAYMMMTAPDSYLAFNHAPNGYGGGLLVKSGDDRDVDAELGSATAGTTGSVYGNDAKRGGGVALLGDDHDARLYLYTTDPARPMRIRGNTASVEGGGIWLRTSSESLILQGWYAWIDDNVAPHGAAMFLDGGEAMFNEPSSRPPDSSDCPVGAPCGGIVGNAAVDGASQPVGGVVEGASHAVFFEQMILEGNNGKFLLDLDNPAVQAIQVLIDGNTSSDSLIKADGAGLIVSLRNTTIAGNSIGGATVFELACRQAWPCRLWGSIVWQPGKTDYIGNWMDRSDSFVSVNPLFVDPEHGDYTLRAGSVAVDSYSSFDSGPGRTDMYGRPRDVAFHLLPYDQGPRDAGAIERQTLQPLVINSDFDLDLRQWNVVTAGATTRDTSQNKSGPANSGSAHVTQANTVTGAGVAGLVQCVPLPGPGTYALNGWGHGTGTMVVAGDIAELYWEYRRGSIECTGTPDATGTLVLSRGNSWSRPATPALIEVSAQDWTHEASIAVTLVAQENGPSGAPTNAWFDGITLELVGYDTIFANGFEIP